MNTRDLDIVGGPNCRHCGELIEGASFEGWCITCYEDSLVDIPRYDTGDMYAALYGEERTNEVLG